MPVTVPGLEFLLTDEPEAAADAAWAAIGRRYRVVPSGERRQVRVWLDTFDGRLRTAGMALAYVTSKPAGRSSATAGTTAGTTAGNELRLHTPSGILRQPATVRWPSLVGALPPGVVADRLRPVAGIRALLPVARVRSSVGEWRLCNRDDKTVVRALLDRAVVADAADGGPLPVRLSLLPLRGYDDPAARAGRILAAVPGVTGDAPPEPDLLAAAGVGPPAAPPAVAMRGDGDAGATLARMLLALLSTMERNVPGVVDDVDTEFLHDLRVSVRRTRSVLKLAGDVLPGDAVARFAPEFKWLGDLTTPMRDLDVFLLDFDDFAGLLTAADPADLPPLREHLHRQRTVERRRLLAGLRSPRFAELTTGWRDALAGVAERDADAARRRRRGGCVAAVAQRRIDRAWRRVSGRAAALTAEPPPEALHDLRKRCKELRYTLELFSGVCRPEPYRAVLKDLKVLQDSLGAFQDAEVHRDKVRGYAAAMLSAGSAPAETLLAMGELVARFAELQRRAAAESLGRVGRLVAESNARQVAKLVRAA